LTGKAHTEPRQVAKPFRNRLRHSFSGLALVRPWAQGSRKQGAWHGTHKDGHTPQGSSRVSTGAEQRGLSRIFLRADKTTIKIK